MPHVSKRIQHALRRVEQATSELNELLNPREEQQDVVVELEEEPNEPPWIHLLQSIDETDIIALRTRSEAQRVVREIEALIPKLSDWCASCGENEVDQPDDECKTPEIHRTKAEDQ